MSSLFPPLRLPPGNFKAYLFDCDGTIADSMPLHFLAWKEALKPWGCDFSEQLFYEWAGTPILKVVEKLNALYGLSMPGETVGKKREEAYLKLLPQIQAIENVKDLILAEHGKIPMAVVSGSPRESVIRTLDALKILHCFGTIVGGDETARGKPAPDPFLLAAQRLGVEPKSCLVFEDADLGFQSAEAAGMKWVRIPQGD